MNSSNVIEEFDKVTSRFLAGLETRLGGEKASSGEKIQIDFLSSADVNVSDLMLRYATDLIYSWFYKQTNLVDYVCERDPHTTFVRESINGSRHPFIEVSMTLPLLRPIVQALMNHFHVFGKMKSKLLESIKQQTALNLQARQEMAQAKEAGREFDPENFRLSDGRVFKHGLIDGFVDSYHNCKVTTREYLHTSMFFVQAGIETLADVLSEFLKYLGTNEGAQEKLRESILKDGIESEYLNWCINETLRLTSPISINVRRAERDIEVEDGVVPAGTLILAPTYAIHRLPELWGGDANQFRPERWEHADKFHPAQFMPFGGGLRMCPGKELALLVVRKFAQILLTRYKLERCAKTSDSPLFEAPLFVYRVPEVPVYLKLSRL